LEEKLGENAILKEKQKGIIKKRTAFVSCCSRGSRQL